MGRMLTLHQAKGSKVDGGDSIPFGLIEDAHQISGPNSRKLAISIFQHSDLRHSFLVKGLFEAFGNGCRGSHPVYRCVWKERQNQGVVPGEFRFGESVTLALISISGLEMCT